MRQLRRLLKEEFPSVERRIEAKGPLFPSYTGGEPEGPVYTCRFAEGSGAGAFEADGSLPEEECLHWLRRVFDRERWKRCGYDGYDHLPVPGAAGRCRVFWKAVHDRRSLHLLVRCRPGEKGPRDFSGSGIEVFIEPRRTLPRIVFSVKPDGSARCIRDDGYLPRSGDPWRVSSCVEGGCWSVRLSIPFDWSGSAARAGSRRPVRFNVVWNAPPEGEDGTVSCSWTDRKPVQGRLVWGTLNPAADFGRLFFGKP